MGMSGPSLVIESTNSMMQLFHVVMVFRKKEFYHEYIHVINQSCSHSMITIVIGLPAEIRNCHSYKSNVTNTRLDCHTTSMNGIVIGTTSAKQNH